MKTLVVFLCLSLTPSAYAIDMISYSAAKSADRKANQAQSDVSNLRSQLAKLQAENKLLSDRIEKLEALVITKKEK